jgi:hypothetical protein
MNGDLVGGEEGGDGEGSRGLDMKQKEMRRLAEGWI